MLNKKSHKEELNLNFVPAIRTTHTGYGNITQEKTFLDHSILLSAFLVFYFFIF